MESNKIRLIISNIQSRKGWKKLIFLLRVPLLILIFVYQKTLSPDHGPMKGLFKYGYCRFHPTCSNYGFEAVLKYGLFRGGYLMLDRIFRCHPWSEGGHDPLK